MGGTVVDAKSVEKTGIQRMRQVVAFALDTLERNEMTPWSVYVSSDGTRLEVFLHTDTDASMEHRQAEAHSLAAALGVPPDLELVHDHDTTYTVLSREADIPQWRPADAGPYAGRSVPFDGELIEVSVTVSKRGA